MTVKQTTVIVQKKLLVTGNIKDQANTHLIKRTESGETEENILIGDMRSGATER